MAGAMGCSWGFRSAVLTLLLLACSTVQQRNQEASRIVSNVDKRSAELWRKKHMFSLSTLIRPSTKIKIIDIGYITSIYFAIAIISSLSLEISNDG